jgi:hypothetical protein
VEKTEQMEKKAVPERKKEEYNGKRGEKDNCNEEYRRRRRRIGMTVERT